MFARQALERTQFADIMRMRGRIEQLRALIDGSIGAQLDDPDVAREYAQLNGAFDAHILPLVDAAVAGGKHGVYAMSAADFSRAIVPHFRPSERLRDRVIDLPASCDRRPEHRPDQGRVVGLRHDTVSRSWPRSRAACSDCCRSRSMRSAAGSSRSAMAIRRTSRCRAASPEITQIHHALETLRHATVRRDMLERQRNDMLTLFSHDMRAPLTSLIILIDTQARRSGDGQMKQQFARIGSWRGTRWRWPTASRSSRVRRPATTSVCRSTSPT